MVEGTALEMRRTCKGTVGSNPTLSASGKGPAAPIFTGGVGDFGIMSGEMTESRQIRILHVFRFFRPKFTGEGIFVERLAPHFAKARPDVIHDVAVTVTPEPRAA